MSNKGRETEPGGEDVMTTKELPPKAQKDIILYSILSAFTRFIPLPFVDDMAENHMERFMITKIAQAYGAKINEDDIKVLAKRTGRSLTKKIKSASAKTLVKKFAKKVGVIFQAKDAGIEFSFSYNVGYLIDYAHEKGFAKQYSPKVLRKAVDQVCDQVDTTPMNHMVTQILKESPSLLAAVKNFVEKTAKEVKHSQVSPAISEEAPKEATDVAERIQNEMAKMSPKYFRELRQSFDRELSASK